MRFFSQVRTDGKVFRLWKSEGDFSMARKEMGQGPLLRAPCHKFLQQEFLNPPTVCIVLC